MIVCFKIVDAIYLSKVYIPKTYIVWLYTRIPSKFFLTKANRVGYRAITDLPQRQTAFQLPSANTPKVMY
jgi:hypothetical protein